MQINEVAKLTGVTVRTLHYYDQIGLLKPKTVLESGYRIYGNEELETLQQILFFRELDFPLNQIKEIMNNPNYDKKEALLKQKELLMMKRTRLDNIIKLVDHVIEGDNTMAFGEFDSTTMEECKKKYAKEVKERWGNTSAYEQSQEKTASYDKNKWKMINEEGAEILKEFGENRRCNPESKTAQKLVKKWQDYISRTLYHCTDEILAGLGQMYLADDRFKNNLDENGEGTAEFIARSIEIYCRK